MPTLPTAIQPGFSNREAFHHGQRGYAGTTWWKASLLENNGWMAVGNVGTRTL